MVLRRFLKALREADWAAALIDSTVVIFSLVLAFQIDRWWETHKKRQDERAYLERLWEESRENLDTAEDVATRHEATTADLLEMNRALATGRGVKRAWRGSDPDCQMLNLPSLRLVSSAYQELVQGDRVDVLRDTRLRELLQRAVAQHEFTNGQLAYFRSAFTQFRLTLGPYERYAIDFEDGSVTCTVALAELSRDPAAVRLLAKLYRDQRRFSGYRREEVEAIRAVHGRLACLLGEPECRR